VVLVDQTAEKVSAHGPAAGHGWLVSVDRCSQVETAARSDGVVVLEVHGQDPLEVSWPSEQDPVQALGPDGADPPSAKAFARGARAASSTPGYRRR
jgi:hypothetical protein